MNKKMVRVGLLLHPQYDSDIIDKINSVENKQGYIKRLIRNDIGVESNVQNHTRTGEDLTGMQFGKWTVVGRDYNNKKLGATMWICICECGNECSVNGQNLKHGKSTQCKMCREKQASTRRADPRRKINGEYTPTYRTWDAMIHRCCYKSQASYKNYGGRGITICDEWRNDYFSFYDYVSKLDRFGEPGMTIDRIDNDKGYEPGNVRWATRAEQNRHRRNNKG